ncbi:MAG: DUF5666 domain-containing protein [Rhodopila sp.]|jgi:hypothetical protein
MRRLAPFLILTLLTACTIPPAQPDGGDQAGGDQAGVADAHRGHQPVGPASDNAGRVGPDGVAPVADRGIGGTGAPASTAVAWRTADRGIGGTGIVGVVTGFGSVFVNGIEVAYDAAASVDIDGDAASVSALRAGQLVAIRAEGPADSPHARMISVRSAAAGRIEAMELNSGTLTIAGQAVSVPAGTWGANHFRLGDWVKVSGLRRDDGTIVASRLDAAPAGVLLARGPVVRDGAVVRLGNLVLTEPAAAGMKVGEFVVVSGDYAAGRGRVSAVASDSLFSSPGDYFGSSASQLVVQAFVRVDKGSISMNGVRVRSDLVASHKPRVNGIGVVSLRREPDGSYTAVGLRYGDYRGHTAPSDGTGAPSQAPPQSGVISGTPSSQQSTSGSVSPAYGPAATAGIAGHPNPVNGSALSAAIPATSTPAESTPVIAPGPPTPASGTSTATQPTSGTSAGGAPEGPTSGPATPGVTPTATPGATPAATPTATTPVAAPTAAPGTTPGGATPGTASGVPSTQSVGSPSPLISSNGGTVTTAALVWNPSQLPGPVSSKPRRRLGSVTVSGSASAPTISLLTAAVTSVTTTVSGTVPSATGNSAKRFTSATTGRGTTGGGTTGTRASSGKSSGARSGH